MKKIVGYILIFIGLGVGILFHLGSQQEKFYLHAPADSSFSNEVPEITNARSAIGTKENLQARREYERAMLVDPRTGQIPQNIKRREFIFSARIPKRISRKSNLRTGEVQEQAWTSIGPYNIGGRTRALAIDVANEKIVLAGGVSGGMWRSVDDGDNWSKTTVPKNIQSVTCIAQDTRTGKENTWYYGTGEFTSNSASKKRAPYRGDGVFKSIDGGVTWNQLSSTAEGIPNNYNSQFQYIWEILTNPRNQQEDEVFLATVGAILRSTDGGDSWEVALGRKDESTPETDLNQSNLSNYSDIIQTSNGVYYAVLSEDALTGISPDRGIYRSNDGINWTRITPGNWPRYFSRTVIAVSENSPNEVYFSVNSDKEMLWKYTYVSGNGTGFGGLWKDLSVNLPAFGGDVGDYDSQQSYNMVLKVHPVLKDVVFLGGTNLYRSSDGFSSQLNTAWIGGYDTANNIKVYPNHYVDQHAVVFYPSNPDKMLSSNDGGVYVTENNLQESVSWSQKNRGFVTSQFYSVGLDEFGSRGVIMGGLQDNGTLIANRPNEISSWNSLLSGDGGYSLISKGALYYYASYQFGKIYRFTLDKNQQSKSFTRVDPANSGGEDKLLFVNPFVLAPENQNIMYYAGGDVIWRNANTSQIPLYKNYASDFNWEKMSGTEFPGGTVTALNASYNPSGTVYFGTNSGQVFRINNANEEIYTIDEITSDVFPHPGYVSSIAIDRKNSNNIAVSFSNYNIISLFYSEDNGQSFENISGNLEENEDGSGSGPSVRWVEIVAKNQGASQLIVGTSTGIFSTNSLNGKSTIWEMEGSESVGNVLVPMIRYFSEDGNIIAATHGNGMYTSRLDDVWKIEIEDNQEMSGFAFGDPYPNPFTNTVKIPFTIPQDGPVRARIYSSLGQHIKTILWANQYQGQNYVSWDGTNEAGTKVASGSYICRLEYEDLAIGDQLFFMR